MKKVCKFAVFDYKKCDFDLVDLLADFLDDNAQTALKFFGIVNPPKIKIKILPTKKEFDEAYIKEKELPSGSTVRGWVVGTFIFEKQEILYLSLKDYKNTEGHSNEGSSEAQREEYAKTIFHEYVHFVNGLFRLKHNCDYSVKCLTEGIATYLSRQYVKLPPFDFTLSELLDENKNIYYAYYLITKYFVENYEKEQVLRAFKDAAFAKELLGEVYDKAKNYYTSVKAEK